MVDLVPLVIMNKEKSDIKYVKHLKVYITQFAHI